MNIFYLVVIPLSSHRHLIWRDLLLSHQNWKLFVFCKTLTPFGKSRKNDKGMRRTGMLNVVYEIHHVIRYMVFKSKFFISYLRVTPILSQAQTEIRKWIFKILNLKIVPHLSFKTPVPLDLYSELWILNRKQNPTQTLYIRGFFLWK